MYSIVNNIEKTNSWAQHEVQPILLRCVIKYDSITGFTFNFSNFNICFSPLNISASNLCSLQAERHNLLNTAEMKDTKAVWDQRNEPL